MVRPILKSISSTELARHELPDNPDNCRVAACAAIGSDVGVAADDFYFDVETEIPESPLEANTYFRWDNGILVVRSFSWETVERALQHTLEGIEGPTWHDVAVRLGRIMDWEFDGYQG